MCQSDCTDTDCMNWCCLKSDAENCEDYSPPTGVEHKEGEPNTIIIHRCAWHKQYFGQKKILSVKYTGHPEGTDQADEDISTENTKIVVSDGMCDECREIFLKENNL